jgi:hypothetical protein
MRVRSCSRAFLAGAAVCLACLGCGARSGLEIPVVDAGLPAICKDAAAPLIYALTAQGALLSYDPPTGNFTPIGTLDCPVPTPGTSAFSMAVDRGGTAYVVFTDGNLYRVSTKDASCQATSFVVGQQGFVTFGLAFSADASDAGETLFVAEEDFDGPSLGLATIDVSTLSLSLVGPFSTTLGQTELTGTGDGRLFGFSFDFPGPGSHVSQIDKTTAAVLSSIAVSFGNFDDGHACAFWGGSFYLFDASQSGPATSIARYDPGNPTVTMVGTYPDEIVGAGASTCAPP